MESVIASAVLAIGVLGLITIQQVLQGSPNQNGEALRFASGQVDRIRIFAARESLPSCDYPKDDGCPLMAADSDCSFSRTIGSTAYTVFTRISLDTTSSTKLRFVEVKCCWQKNNRYHQVELTTLLNEAFY